MSLYAVFETALVGAAVAAGGVSALRTFAPGALRRLAWWKRAARPEALQRKSAACNDCGSCGGCPGRSERRD
jgi:hypothetical protein